MNEAVKLNYDLLTTMVPQEAEQTFIDKDTMLYALGIGLGYDPTNEDELRFVYEKDLKAFPTFPVVLGAPRGWLRERATGIDWVKVVHGEHSLQLHKTLPGDRHPSSAARGWPMSSTRAKARAR